jgi:hypothetical protein
MLYIKDTAGCVKTKNFNVSQPNPINIGISTQEANCGVNNGSATATPTGGNGGFNYAWSSGGGAATAAGLGAGSYTVTVTDSRSCTATQIATISNIGAPTVTPSAQSVSCFGDNDGVANLSISGGQSPYSIAWSAGGNDTTRNNLSPGSYTATVTDGAGCLAVVGVSIPEPDSLGISLQHTDETCGKGNGSIAATVTGGTPIYNYNWSGGAGSTGTVSGLSAGNFTLTVTDDNGCVKTASASLTNIPGPTSLTNVEDESCSGKNDGTIDLIVSGGTNPITYIWSNGAQSQDVSNLAPGSYTVTVTDGNNCENIVNSTVGTGVVISVNTVVNPASSSIANDGKATANGSGGSGPYNYLWSNNQQGNTATGLGIGTYFVTVTDQNGCAKVDTININVTSLEAIPVFNTIRAYPNPTGDFVTVNVELNQSENLSFSLSDLLGKSVYQQDEGTVSSLQKVIDLSDFAEGLYLLEISAGDYQRVIKIIKQEP